MNAERLQRIIANKCRVCRRQELSKRNSTYYL